MTNEVSTEALRQTITRLLPSGRPTIDRVAYVHGISARSLQRRLTEAGLSYSSLLGEVRLERAHRLLVRCVPDAALISLTG